MLPGIQGRDRSETGIGIGYLTCRFAEHRLQVSIQLLAVDFRACVLQAVVLVGETANHHRDFVLSARLQHGIGCIRNHPAIDKRSTPNTCCYQPLRRHRPQLLKSYRTEARYSQFTGIFQTCRMARVFPIGQGSLHLDTARGFAHHPMHHAFGQGRGHDQAHIGTASRLAEDGHPVRITTEIFDVRLHPLQYS